MLLQQTGNPEAAISVEEDGTCLEDYLTVLYFSKSYKPKWEMEGIFFKSYANIRKWVDFTSQRLVLSWKTWLTRLVT